MSKNNKLHRAAVACGLCIAAGAAHSVNLIANGSFEDVVGPGAVALPGVGTDSDTTDGIDNGT